MLIETPEIPPLPDTATHQTTRQHGRYQGSGDRVSGLKAIPAWILLLNMRVIRVAFWTTIALDYTNLVGICGWSFRRTPALRDCPIPQDKPQLPPSREELEQNVKYLMAEESSYLTLLWHNKMGFSCRKAGEFIPPFSYSINKMCRRGNGPDTTAVKINIGRPEPRGPGINAENCLSLMWT